jgi:hypothetical protein
MRKTVGIPINPSQNDTELVFLNIEQLAQVDVSSESPEHPIEAALIDGHEGGWQAASPGKQIIRLHFDQPVSIKHIVLVIEEYDQTRTQELTFSWLAEGTVVYQEILRQQFGFSPPSTIKQSEHYQVELNQLKSLELMIIPDISQGSSIAKVAMLRLG